MKLIWRRHTTVVLVLGVAALIIASAVSYMVTTFTPKTEVRLGYGVYNLELADTDAERYQGLSGRERLGPNEGILFDFERPGSWGIVMRDMLIPIDIIWLDEDKAVVTIVKNAPPELGETKVYRPTQPARYVLELQAGAVNAAAIKVGDVAQFEVRP